MNRRHYMISTALVLVVLGGMVLSRSLSLQRASTIYLELAPVDPRSLMQGDYMVINYGLTRTAASAIPSQIRSGYLVVQIDKRGIGRFARLDDDRRLAADELRLRFRRHGRMIELGAGSFFFEEGQGSRFASARYGEIKVTETGDCTIVGLSGENLDRL